MKGVPCSPAVLTSLSTTRSAWCSAHNSVLESQWLLWPPFSRSTSENMLWKSSLATSPSESCSSGLSDEVRFSIFLNMAISNGIHFEVVYWTAESIKEENTLTEFPWGCHYFLSNDIPQLIKTINGDAHPGASIGHPVPWWTLGNQSCYMYAFNVHEFNNSYLARKAKWWK